jgi:hypothetical protein
MASRRARRSICICPWATPSTPKCSPTHGRPVAEVRGPASATMGRLIPLRNRRPQRPLLPGRPAPSILRRPSPTHSWKSRFRPRFTLRLVDQMLMVTRRRRRRLAGPNASVEYLRSSKACSRSIKGRRSGALNAAAAAQILYIKDASGTLSATPRSTRIFAGISRPWRRPGRASHGLRSR